MGIAQRIAEHQPGGLGRPCAFCKFVRAQDKDDQEALNAAFKDPRISDVAIAKILGAEGHECTANTVARHRRGLCRTQADS